MSAALFLDALLLQKFFCFVCLVKKKISGTLVCFGLRLQSWYLQLAWHFGISKKVKLEKYRAKAEREYFRHGGLMPVAAQAIREANGGLLPNALLEELKKENQKKFRKSPRSRRCTKSTSILQKQ